MTAQRTEHHRPIVLIVGPTAGGKTRLAIDLALALPGGGECISADSMQIYRGMDIGTAKPPAEERAAVTHHLLDLVDPSDDGFSVDTWMGLAEQCIRDIRQRGRWPIVVGGTNLYIQALMFGLVDGPEPDPERRGRLHSLDPSTLRARLEEVDPVAAARIHPNDRKRTIRAIEVFEMTGEPLSQRQTQWSAMHGREDLLLVGLDYPVEQINRRINARVKAMFEQGLVEEVRRLHAAQRLGRQAAAALGYAQVIDYIEGRCSLEEAREEIKVRTRRFAKQQRTWLRRFRVLDRALWIHAGEDSPQSLSDQALAFVLRQAGD